MVTLGCLQNSSSMQGSDGSHLSYWSWILDFNYVIRCRVHQFKYVLLGERKKGVNEEGAVTASAVPLQN